MCVKLPILVAFSPCVPDIFRRADCIYLFINRLLLSHNGIKYCHTSGSLSNICSVPLVPLVFHIAGRVSISLILCSSDGDDAGRSESGSIELMIRLG